MAQLKSMTTDAIIKELNFGGYIPNPKERDKIVDMCKNVLNAQINKTYDQKEQVECTLNFIEALWDKYDCKDVANIYSKFIKIEEALYGLEREEESGERYRDHFVHMFNTLIFGLRIISELLSKLDEDKAKQLFKIKKENLKEVGLPFSSNYNHKNRLFYLWILISTFHDIAIPIQHLTKIGEGISKFTEEFGLIFTDPSVSMRSFDSSQLYNYFCLLSRIYGGNLGLDKNGIKYITTERPQDYLVKILGREFDRRNHGVLSGFFMFKTIEEIFLLGRSNKYRLGIKEFNSYAEYVLEQDIARAALAISLHSMEEDQRTKISPKVFPMDFGVFPLSFLLILSDELQEYLRWEGTSIKRNIKFNYQPKFEVKLNGCDIQLKVMFSLDCKHKDYIIEQAGVINDKKGIITPIKDIDNASDVIGNSIKEKLEKKLNLGENFKLELVIYGNWKRKLYGKELSTKK